MPLSVYSQDLNETIGIKGVSAPLHIPVGYSYKSSFNDSVTQFNTQSHGYLSRIAHSGGTQSQGWSQPVTPVTNGNKNAAFSAYTCGFKSVIPESSP